MSSTAVTWIVLGVIVLFVIWIIMIYNGLVAMRQRVSQAFSDIDVQPKQRHDLIPNLGRDRQRLCQPRARHARSGRGRRATPPSRRRRAAHLRRRSRECAQRRAAPALRADRGLSGPQGHQNFQQLQSELSDIENKIAAARRFFNNAVQEYNTGIQQFPAVLLGGPARLHAEGFFDSASSSARSSSRPRR